MQAAIGLAIGWPASRATSSSTVTQRHRKACAAAVAKNSKKFGIVVDSSERPRLYTPHQRGRRAAGDEEVRFFCPYEIKRAA